jgi:uncharacterized protein
MIKNLFFCIVAITALQGMQMEYEEGDNDEEIRMLAIAGYFERGDETRLNNFLHEKRSADEQKKAVSHLLFTTVGSAATAKFVTKLLDCGADPNTKDKQDGYSVLHNSFNYDNTDILSILLDHEGDVNSQNKRGTSLLHTALNHHKYKNPNYCKYVKLLIDRGANVNIVDRNEFTPLRYAKDVKCDACIKLLVEHGGVEKE